MPLLYNVSDFTVVPSLVEGFGLVVAESLACGKPVIGSGIGGIVDQIIDGYNGYLVHPKDPLSLAEKMQTLIEDDSLRIEMSKNARIYAEANLDLKIRIDRLLKIYNEVVDT
jgi:glycosyltransferase involved in cell wall biosynthesis